MKAFVTCRVPTGHFPRQHIDRSKSVGSPHAREVQDFEYHACGDGGQIAFGCEVRLGKLVVIDAWRRDRLERANVAIREFEAFVNALNSVDLPALGNPTIPQRNPT